jgi:argininosuccinate lyase
VLNGTSWPLNRARMASYLGFPGTVENAYDAAQIAAADLPVEIGAVTTGIALHAGAYLADVMVQYAQPRPWLLLTEGEGNTYVSSAMPQKRNPGVLNDARRQASMVVTLATGRAIAAHNIPPGMNDPKSIPDNLALTGATLRLLEQWDRILKALALNPERALEELNSDWTASQEIADVLMREHQLPFRAGHHFASVVVDYARAHDIRPSDFPYAEARRLYRETLAEMHLPAAELPLTEAAFRTALDPAAIVRARATPGGPQPAEMARMVAAAQARLAAQELWVAAQRGRIDGALAQLDADFGRVLALAH